MSATMEPKIKREKKEKSSKKRKAGESLEDTVHSPAAAAEPDSPPPTSERKSKKKSSHDEVSTTTSKTSDEPPSKKRKSTSTIPAEIEVDITAPTPPTKRALRLLKKGKAAPPLKPDNRPDSSSEAEASQDEDATAGSKTKSKKAKPEVEKRSDHGIWIGNLPWSCDKNALRAFLTVPNTSIPPTAITRIHMPSPADALPANHVPDARNSRKPQNKGFAYVDFAGAEHVALALEMSEELLTGRRVLIKDQKSFEGRPEKTKEEKRLDAGGKPPNRRVFLGNLRYDATVESLTEHFSPCGAVEMVFVATFEDSGKCKGFAWITFAELEAAEKAVRGWTMVPQATSNNNDDDDDDDDNSADSEDSASDEEPKKPVKMKMKKVWVNQIFGRPVRREFAEDAQVRYKKRYGKDGTKAASTATATASDNVDGAEAPVKARGTRIRPESSANDDASGAVPQAKPADFYRNAYAPRLTGGVVASTGKKVVF